MFSKLFGKKKAERPILSHPKDLRVGDLLEIGLCPISELNGQTFTIIEANTLDYGDGLQIAFLMRSHGQNYGLYVNSNDEGESLNFSKLIKRADVEKIFTVEVFGQAFEEGCAGSYPVVGRPSQLEDWLDAECYYKTVDALKGYFEKGDHRLEKNSGNVEEFDFYEMQGSNPAFGIEIEAYGGDETEVYVTRNLPMHSIDKLWPQEPKDE